MILKGNSSVMKTNIYYLATEWPANIVIFTAI
jgi:hypothetical protein